MSYREKQLPAKVLVLTQDLSQLGGVSNYFNTLSLNDRSQIDYYQVNNDKADKLWKKLSFLLYNYTKFILTIPKYNLIQLNPSLNFRSYHREMVFLIISKIFFKKIIVFFRGWDEEFESKLLANNFKRYLFKFTYGRVNQYIVLGECFKEKIINIGIKNNENIEIETTVADSSGLENFELNDKYKTYDEEIKFLFISRILKEKGIYIAIDAYHMLRSITSDMKTSLWIAGEGEELERAKLYVKENDISGVNFTGDVRGQKKFRLLKESHVMLFPTYHAEGLPNSILEGMLYGMPIISRPVGAVPDVVKINESGFLSDSLDSSTFTNFMRVLVTNKNEYIKISTHNHQMALDAFTTDKVRARIINLYHKLLQ